MWAIFMPNLFLLYRLLFSKRRTTPPSDPSMTEHVLLEASNTGGRVIQSLLPLIGTVLGIIGVTMLFRADGGVGVASVALTVAGAVLIVLPLRHVIGWDVSYKGHGIRFENDRLLRRSVSSSTVSSWTVAEWAFTWSYQGRLPAATARATSSGPRPTPDFPRSIAESSPSRRPACLSGVEGSAQRSNGQLRPAVIAWPTCVSVPSA